jgi:hypothetical protein
MGHTYSDHNFVCFATYPPYSAQCSVLKHNLSSMFYHHKWPIQHCSFIYSRVSDVCEPQHMEFRPSVITHFHTIASTSRNHFWQNGINNTWLASWLPQSPNTAQIVVSLVRLFLSLSEVDRFCDLWIRHTFSHFKNFMLPKSACILLKTNLHAF